MPARSPEYMDDMRERILAATSHCLKVKGLAEASLTDVCQQAQISRGALYVHFKSKSELLCAVVERSIKRVQSMYSFADAARLRQMLIDEFNCPWADDPNDLYSEMEFLAAARSDAALRDTIRRSVDSRSELFRVGVRALRKRGELRDDLSDTSAALTLSSFFEGMLTLTFGTPTAQDVSAQAVDALLAGVLKPKVLRALTE